MRISLFIDPDDYNTHTARQISVEVAVEDTQSDVCLLTIDNYPGMFHASVASLDANFPSGTVLVVREPLILLSETEKWPLVRVDSPSDVLVLGPSDSFLKGVRWATSSTWPQHPLTALGWKELGTTFYREKQFLAAAHAWDQGLDLEPSNADILLNRSMAYLQLKWFGAALADALSGLAVARTDDSVYKAEYRAASAEYGMAKYVPALERFERIASRDTAAVNWVARCKARLIEAEGKFNWEVMFTAGLKAGCCLDVANFVGPIEVAVMPRHGGRGLRAARNLKAGDLLVRNLVLSVFSKFTCVSL